MTSGQRTILRHVSSGIIRMLMLIINLFMLCQHPVSAQSLNTRPRLGLALSGGGALGMAHVGVLKVMEEAGLRPDFITGVSMGSIVGGFYSIGYSPDSLKSLFTTVDWNLILSNNIPENKVIFTEKKNFNNSVMSLPISSRKVHLPSSLINGQQIENMLSYYAWPSADISDFSKLPIPFMCLATDLITCKKTELKTGYLPDAIRASMAVPSIFNPMKIDTAVLIDGGFVRNIAASEVREMGADIVIGSYTGFHKYNEEELQSMTGVIKQLGFFNSINDYSNEKENIDILIEPKLKDFSSTVFTDADSIIERGYKAALPFKEKFRKLADSLDSFGPQEQVTYILNKHSYSFDKIEITGNDNISDEQILGVIDIKPGEEVDKNALSEKIELLYGKVWFDKVKYKIVPENKSLTLVIECIEKPQTILYGSVHFDNTLKAGILLSVSARNLLTPRSAIDIESFIGECYRLQISYTQFIDHNQRVGLSAGLYHDNTYIPVIQLKGETGKVAGKLFSAGLSLNSRIGLNQMMSISADFENLNLIPDYVSVNKIQRLSYNYISTTYLNQINTLDTKHFPNKGTTVKLFINGSRLLSGIVKTSYFRETYTKGSPDDFLFRRAYAALGDFRYYFSPGRKVSLSIGGNFLFTHTKDSVPSPNNYYFLGGQESITRRTIPMTGFHTNEVPVQKLASFGIDTDLEFYSNLHLGLLTNLAVAQEVGNGHDNLTLLGGYGFQLGYMSIIGPVKVGIMQGLSSNERYFRSIKGFISIGFSF